MLVHNRDFRLDLQRGRALSGIFFQCHYTYHFPPLHIQPLHTATFASCADLSMQQSEFLEHQPSLQMKSGIISLILYGGGDAKRTVTANQFAHNLGLNNTTKRKAKPDRPFRKSQAKRTKPPASPEAVEDSEESMDHTVPDVDTGGFVGDDPLHGHAALHDQATVSRKVQITSTVGTWAANNDLSYTSVNELLQDVLPKLEQLGLFPGGIDWASLPHDYREMTCVIREALGDKHVEPTSHKAIVCERCGYTVHGKVCKLFRCGRCLGHKTLEISFHVWDLKALVARVVADFSIQLLDHCIRPDLPKHSSLKSERFAFFRDLMDDKSGVDPRHIIFLLHHDSFAPFRSHEDHSCGYVLLQPRWLT